MPTSDLEQLVCGEVSFNDQVKLSMETLDFTPAQAKPKFAENPNASGAVLVEEPQYTPAYFELTVRVIPAADTDAALVVVGEVMDALTGCARIEGGRETLWTPNDATTTYAAYAILGELLEIPITVDGETAGWFIESPLLKIKLTCRPFLFTEERQVLASVESEDPLQIAYVSGVGGDVPAEGRLVLTDKAEQQRRFVEWGAEQVESEEGNPAVFLEADEDFSLEGFQGELAEEEGSHSTKVIKVQLTGGRVTVAAALELPHKDYYYGKLRVLAEDEGALFRLIYRTADGEWSRLPWISPPVTEEWCELSMRELSFEEVEQGAQVSEIRIEAKCEEGAQVGYIDTMGLTPTQKGHGVGRGLAEGGASLSEGPNSPGKGETKEGEGSGEKAWANPENIKASDDSRATVVLTNETDPSQHLVSSSHGFAIPEGASISDAVVEAEVSKSGIGDVKGTAYLWGASGIIASGSLGGGEQWPTTDKYLSRSFDGGPLTPAIVNNSAFGASVVVSVSSIGGEPTARVDHIRITVYYETETGDNIICHESQSAEIRHDGAERENESGSAWAPISHYRGADFYLPPEGDAELLLRIVAKMRRKDTGVEADELAGLTDAQSLEVLARERWLAPR